MNNYFSTLFLSKNRLFFILFIVPIFFLADFAYAASKTLMISPVRVVFSGRQRSATINVANTNPEPVTYRVSLVTMQKDSQGRLSKTKQDNEREKLTKSLIRFSPRRATIQPGTRQVVKLMVRKPKDLPIGEYQIRLRVMPLADKIVNSPNKFDKNNSPKIKIDLIVGVTIPIIVQHGEAQAEITPLSLALRKNPQAPSGLATEVTFTRIGEYSAFGDIIVSYIPVSGKGKKLIGTGKSVGFYFPDPQRTVTIPLKNWDKGDQSSGGKLRVEFVKDTHNNQSPLATFKDFTF